MATSDNFPRENLVRAFPERTEVRANDEGMPTLVVRFARYGEWNEIDSIFEGRFLERVDKGAFTQTFKQDRDRFRLLFQHGRDPVVGDKPLAAVSELREDPQGPYAEGPMLDTSYNRDILPGLEAGVYGSSYKFSVNEEDIVRNPKRSDHNPEGLPERTILSARVYEAGPVTFPADPKATAGVRSLTDWYRSTDDFATRLGEYARTSPGELAKLIQSALPTSGLAMTSAAAPGSVSVGTVTYTTTGTTSNGPTTTPPPQRDGSAPAPVPANPPASADARDTAIRTRAMQPKEDEVPTDIDRFTSVELLTTRRSEIEARQEYLNTEFAGKAFPSEIKTEWDDLTEERAAITERVTELEARQKQLESYARNAGKVEPPKTYGGGGFAVHTGGKVENIYDLAEHRRAASSPAEETRLLRDSMKRSLDASVFTNPKLPSREYAQEAVSDTLDKLDRDGALASYMLATGSDRYREAFGRWATSGGLAPMDAQAQMAIEQARTYEARAFTLGSTGLPVPYQLDPTIIPISNWSVNPFRAISRVEQTVVNEWRGATSAGITAAYAAEATEASDNTPTLTQPTIAAVRAQAFVPFSIEVQQDWSVIEAEMAKEIQDAKDDVEALKYTSGNGTNEPFGLITGATTTVATTTTGAFVVADLYKMEEALPPRFRPRASILGNRFVFNKARQFDTAGGSGVWLDGSGLQQGLANQVPTPGAIGPRLLGYPAFENSNSDAALTTGSKILVMGDFRYFVIVDRVGMSVDLLPQLVGTNHRPTGQRGLYAFWRNGSKVINAAAFRTLLT